MKNILAIKDRILFHMDRSKSPRYTNHVLSQAIQVATSNFVNDRYDNIKQAEIKYAFESSQRIRDEIRTIVETTTLVPVNKVADLPTDYMYDVGVRLFVDGVWRNSIPKSIGERLGGERNIFTRPTLDYPVHEEIRSQLRCYLPRFTTFTGIELYYIKKYDLPLITDTTIAAGVNVLTAGTTYHVETSTVTYDGTTYQVTDTFTAGAVLTFTGAGIVRPIIEVPLPDAAHEEIAKRAAALLSGIVENFNRNQLKQAEIQQQ